MDIILVVLACLALLLTCTAYIHIRANWMLFNFIYHVVTLVASELAVFMIAGQAIFSLLWVYYFGLTLLSLLALLIFGVNWALILFFHFLGLRTKIDVELALNASLGEGYRNNLPSARRQQLDKPLSLLPLFNPFPLKPKSIQRIDDIAYGDHPRNKLDLYLPVTPATSKGAPILLYVHGGTWMVGSKRQQGRSMLFRMAELGWACADINYRLSPASKFPDHIIDVKKAICWLKQNGAEYGLNTEFIALAGASAGGHLASLGGLTANLAAFQPGFENCDTRVQACVPIYGAYDLIGRSDSIWTTLEANYVFEKVLMPRSYADDPDLWHLASPQSQINADAPPMMIIRAGHDSLIGRSSSKLFADTVANTSKQLSVYAVIDKAQHAYDNFYSVRTHYTVEGIARFLEYLLQEQQQQRLGNPEE